ncbi:SDR family NAD(P)-dependent oxidoreductase [Silvanigrella aquatica]|uniref:SDR family NAD(P)-dependent oxidoreductase n=1 Tax=Silvanigrella aquatica TaxID=1915309 RepID=UPI0011E5F755|nr:SDR family oxidoreductase [Silvanigrella aquatica]
MILSKLINKAPKTFNTTRKPIALITGASSGIGQALSYHFASKGYDIVTVARDNQRLQEIKSILLAKYNSQVYVCAVDLTKSNSIQIIKDFLIHENLEINALVNNAGFGIHGSFEETDLNSEIDMIQVQINTTLALTKLVLPMMQTKKSGYILNVGSVYSFAPVPFQSVYGACKSFLLSFSNSLAFENKKYGIKVTALCPGITQTEFRMRSNVGRHKISNKKSIKNSKPTGMSAEQVAEQGYNALMKGDIIAIPGLTNRIFVQIATHLPTSLLSSSLALVNNFRGVNSKHT